MTRRTLTLLMSIGLALSMAMPVTADAGMAQRKAQSCKVTAKHDADNKARGRIFKTAAMGGMTALVVGAIISANNKSGKEINRGLWGGGVIAGKAYKIQWKRDYDAAFAACRRHR